MSDITLSAFAAEPNDRRQTAYVPQVRPLPATAPKGLAVLKGLRGNFHTLWPQEAYDSDSFVLEFLGRKMFLFSSPDTIRHVLMENDENYLRSPIRDRVLRPVLGNGLTLAEGNDAREQRRNLAPAFTPRATSFITGHVAAGTTERIGSLRQDAPSTVDLFTLAHRWAIAISAKTMFSIGDNKRLNALQRMTEFYFRTLGFPFFFDVLMPRHIPSPHDLLRRVYQVPWMRMVEKLMDNRLALPPMEKTDFFDLLRSIYKPEAGEPSARVQLRDQISTMLVSGHETTSMSIFWTLVLVASVPGVQEKLVEELKGLDLSEAGILESYPKLVYAKALVNEAMRLFPPVFMIARTAIGQDSVGGVDVPPGSTVLVSPWVLHRRRALWDRPEEFDPSRFMPGAKPPARMSYLPFSVGPRVCIAAQMATMMSTVVVAKLIAGFDLKIEGSRPVLPSFEVITRPDHHPRAVLTPRPKAA